jgi:four helix bundle protein
MATIMKFEDLDAWQAARSLAKAVYAISSIGRFSKDFILKNQIRRSAISAMSNIAEGFERDGNREFLQFLTIAKGSCGEIRAQLL